MNGTGIDRVVVRPAARVAGTLRVPGDKSISHRLAMLAAAAGGESVIEGFLASDDCLNTLRAMAALGAGVDRAGERVTVRGTGGRFRAPAGPLDMGNSGTGMRLAAGLLAGQPFTAEMTGDASLRSRPMGRIREPLERMGARVELLGARECAPVRIAGGALEGIEYRLPMASAQVKSCVLLAGLYARGVTRVVEPKPTRDHTERLLQAMGAEIEVDGATVALTGAGPGVPALRAGRWTVPGDFSSAAYALAAGAVAPRSEVAVTAVGLNPRRTAFLDVLRRMGAAVEVVETGGDPAWEPAGTVRVRAGRLRGARVAGDEIPNLIDELPLVAVMGALAEGETVIADAGELRVKESDRIATVAAGLRAMGVRVEEREDGLRVWGADRIKGRIAVESAGDHRIAMALAVAALRADGPVEIRGTACVSTSYPGFWTHREALRAG